MALGAVAYFTIGKEQQEEQRQAFENIPNRVAADVVAQYEMAKRQGDPMQVCVQAGMVSAAWLQAKNEAQYRAAKATEKADCARAGMPQP